MTLRQVANPGLGALDRLTGALHRASGRNINVLCIGDSVTEGAMATNFIDNRWVTKFVRNLQTNYNSGVGGVGWVNVYASIVGGPGIGSSTAQWAGNGSHAGVTGDTRAFGSRLMTWATNEVVTFTYTGTSFKLMYLLGGSNFTVNVDGGGAVTVTVAAGSTNQGAYQSPILAHGAHTAVITPTAGQALTIRGAVVYDGDEANGITIFDHGLYGITSSTVLTTTGSTTGLTDPLSANFCANPDLVVIMLGLNDDNHSVSTATYTTNIQSVIANVKALCTNSPTFLVCGQWNAPGYATNAAAFDTAAQSIATADPLNVLYSSFFGLISSGNSTMYLDNIHPNDAGMVAIANQMSALIPTTSPSFSDGGTRPHPFQPGLAR